MATQFANDLPPLLIILAVIGVSAAGGLVPFSPIEPMLAALAVTRPAMIGPLVLLAAVCQMSTKSLLFAASNRAADRITGRKRERIDALRRRLDGHPRLQRMTVLLSAFSGLPPFYAVTVASGLMRIRFRDFMIAGSLGRALRFAAIATLFGAASLDAQPRTAGETYVLVSGIVGGRAGFNRLETELQRRGARVLVVDPYALSIDSVDVTFAAMARRVDRVLEREGITNARLVGHAHGGGVMLRLAATFPHRASAVYFLDVGALPENRTRVLSRSMRLAPVVVKLPYGRDVVRRKLVTGLRENSAGDAWLDAATQRSYTETVLDHMGQVIALAERLAATSEPEPVADVVARLRVPALVILGDAPRTSKPTDAEVQALASTGRARIERLRGVGHFPHEEAPAVVAALLTAAPVKQVAQVLP